jgi:uncharacterized protein YjbJ (UPF0337 family)
MNWDKVEGNWKQMSGTIKQKWGKLTDNDLSIANGKREEFIGRLQERYGIARDEAERQLQDFLDANREPAMRY